MPEASTAPPCGVPIVELLEPFLDALEGRYLNGAGGAVTSMGEATLNVQLAAAAAADHGAKLRLSVLDGSVGDVVEVIVSAVAGIGRLRFRKAQLTDRDWRKLDRAIDSLRDADLIVDDRHDSLDEAMRCAARQAEPQRILVVHAVQWPGPGGR